MNLFGHKTNFVFKSLPFRIYGVILAITLGFGIFTYTQPTFAQTQTVTGESKPQTAAERPIGTECAKGWLGPLTLCHIVQFGEKTVDSVGGGLLALVATFFEKMIYINTDVQTLEARAQIGWTVTRDIANIFYIFILLWIALATIFNIDKFSAKNLLPKLVISALLINFSLVIGATIIKTANNLALVYYKNTNLNKTLREMSVPTEILSKLQENAASEKIVQLTGNPSESKLKEAQDELFQNVTYKPPSDVSFTALECKNRKGIYQTDAEQKHCPALLQLAEAQLAFLLPTADSEAKNDYLVTTKLSAIPLKLVVYPIAIFTIGAGAIFLLARYLTLIFVLTLGPLAFAAMILPGTQEHWNKWWKKLIDQSVFFPAFVILLFIGAKILAANRLGGTSEYLVYGQSVPSFIDLLIQVFIGGGFLIGSLIAAQQLGIAGANKIMSTGEKWAKGAGDYAKRGVLAPVRSTRDYTLEKTGVLKKIQERAQKYSGYGFGIGKLAARVDKGLQEQQKSLFKRRHGIFTEASPENAWAHIQTLNPNEQKTFIEKYGEDKFKKAASKGTSEQRIALGKRLQSVGGGQLITGALTDPEEIVQIFNPTVTKGSSQYKEQVVTVLKGMNKRELSPDFIARMDPEMMRSLTPRDLQDIQSTGKGAASFSKQYQKLNEEMFTKVSAAYQDAYKQALAGGQVEAVARSQAEQTAQNLAKSLTPLNKATETYMKSTAGQALLGGISIPKMAGGGVNIKDIEKLIEKKLEEHKPPSQ